MQIISDKKIDRLEKLLEQLMKNNLTSKELIDRLNYENDTDSAKMKAIQRDLQNLQNFFTLHKYSNRYYLQDNLSKDFSARDHLFFRIHYSDLRIDDKMEFLDRLKKQDKNPIYAKIDIEKFDKTKIAILEKAIIKKEQIEFKFNDDKRTFLPCKIALFNGYWYLIGLHDIDTNKVYKYKLRDLENIKILDEIFIYPNWLDEFLEKSVNIWFDTDKEPIEIELLIKNELVDYFKNKPISITQSGFRKIDNEHQIFTVKITNYKEVLSIIKRWIPDLIVLNPPELREIIINETEEYLKKMEYFK